MTRAEAILQMCEFFTPDIPDKKPSAFSTKMAKQGVGARLSARSARQSAASSGREASRYGAMTKSLSGRGGGGSAFLKK